MVTNEGEVYFALYGDIPDPEEITRIVGLAPTSTLAKATPIPRQTMWKFSTGNIKSEVIDVYTLASSIVEELRPYEHRINEAKLRLRLDAELQVVLTIQASDNIPTPAIGFSPEVVSFLARIGSSIDVDTYIEVPGRPLDQEGDS